MSEMGMSRQLGVWLYAGRAKTLVSLHTLADVINSYQKSEAEMRQLALRSLKLARECSTK
jgi:hypothetical protein